MLAVRCVVPLRLQSLLLRLCWLWPITLQRFRLDPRLLWNINRKSYLTSEMLPLACCSGDWKCPKSPPAATEFGTRHHYLITELVNHAQHISNSVSICVCLFVCLSIRLLHNGAVVKRWTNRQTKNMCSVMRLIFRPHRQHAMLDAAFYSRRRTWRGFCVLDSRVNCVKRLNRMWAKFWGKGGAKEQCSRWNPHPPPEVAFCGTCADTLNW